MTHRADDLSRYLDVLAVCLETPDASGADVAARAYLSRHHFDRLARAALGEPPAAFRRRILLERAAYALSTTDLAVVDVATQAGYDSREGFTRAFAGAYGRAPGRWRTEVSGRGSYELTAGNGVHFQPPSGLRIPEQRKVTEMNILPTLLRFHVDLVGAITVRIGSVDDAELDRRLDMDVEWVDAQPYSLRALVDGLVTQEERYLFAIRGEERPDPDTSVAGLRRRHEAAGPALAEFATDAVERGILGDTFVMAECDPPRSTTFGGALLHVTTFGAVRRTMALRALAAATGDDSLGWGDPIGLFDVA